MEVTVLQPMEVTVLRPMEERVLQLLPKFHLQQLRLPLLLTEEILELQLGQMFLEQLLSMSEATLLLHSQIAKLMDPILETLEPDRPLP
jgi:hypothetical protein